MGHYCWEHQGINTESIAVGVLTIDVIQYMVSAIWTMVVVCRGRGQRSDLDLVTLWRADEAHSVACDHVLCLGLLHLGVWASRNASKPREGLVLPNNLRRSEFAVDDTANCLQAGNDAAAKSL